MTTVEASHFDFNAAYASVDRHQLQDFEPYVYRTRDMGKCWQKITSGLPAGVYVHAVKEDPKRQGLLVAGTERGAFVSLDDGDNWHPLQLNMPVTSVRDFEFYENDLIVATHGRGFWVIDDISPLRQVNDAVLAADAHLFKPADAINVLQGGDNGTPLQKDEPQAMNPPNGAVIDFYLKSAATGTVTLEILDAAGTTCAHVHHRGPEPARRTGRSRRWDSRTHLRSGARRLSRSRRARECIAWCGTPSPVEAVAVGAEVVAAAAAEAARPDSRERSRRNSASAARATRRRLRCGRTRGRAINSRGEWRDGCGISTRCRVQERNAGRGIRCEKQDGCEIRTEMVM